METIFDYDPMPAEPRYLAESDADAYRARDERIRNPPGARMKPLYILKVGTTFPDTARRLGDFDDWTRAGLGDPGLPIEILAVAAGAPLPPPGICAGAVITGAHEMVTDDLPWSLALECWLPTLLNLGRPVLGICYGHQLLARALGGTVGTLPGGSELGTLSLRTAPERVDDPLFGSLPERFLAQVAHEQSVLMLPPGAVALAASAREPHHAVRFGPRAWGVQFHPEFDTAVMRDYLQAETATLAADRASVADRSREVAETPEAAAVLARFGRLAADIGGG